ncbi:hypothetical protein GUK36_36345 [Rhizobium leguminosarum]|uniref:Histidine kinase/HSP90-like ATPase domain-containing protein n=1 Tax=Rhizobium leguminosarum TaxID=384 RepID=A0A6P0DQZ8_RHILE|nr:ATP-binding protein [Rhizobium leguminosarum]NEK54777.1 hypothetical protein [Rhizobium leguminosarum]
MMTIRQSIASNEELRESVEELAAEISELCDGDRTCLSTKDRPAPLASIAASVVKLRDYGQVNCDEDIEGLRDYMAFFEHEATNRMFGARLQMEIVHASLRGDRLIKHVKLALECLSHFEGLSRKLREFALVTSSSAPTSLETIDLVQSCQRAIDCEIGGNTQYSETVIFETSDCPTCMRTLDPELPPIIFRNLIKNALIHGMPGGRINVTFESDGTFTIINRAPLVSLENSKNLTQKYRRGVTNAQGSGIGLYLVRKSVEKLGGVLKFPKHIENDHFTVTVHFPR